MATLPTYLVRVKVCDGVKMGYYNRLNSGDIQFISISRRCVLFVMRAVWYLALALATWSMYI